MPASPTAAGAPPAARRSRSLAGPPTIATARLLLRAPEPADVEALFAIQEDAKAMRHTRIAPDRDATARFLEAHTARFSQDGFAPWTALLRSQGCVVGWGGLLRDPEAPQWGPEVAYFLHRDYWGRGLASELVRAALRLAFGDLDLAEVAAFTRPENHRSRRLLERTGFAFAGHVPELERDRYAIHRRAWEDAARRDAH